MANAVLGSWGAWVKSAVGENDDSNGIPSENNAGSMAAPAATVDSFLNAGKTWLTTSTQQIQAQIQTLTETKGKEGIDNPSKGENEASGGDQTTQEVKDKALQFGKGLLAGVSSFATTIKTTVESAKDEWEREQQRFTSQKKKAPGDGPAIAPWEGFAEEDMIRSQVLALSSDQRNFLVDPPPGAHFLFDYDTYASTAIAAMAHDPELQRLRYELVPKTVSEVSFWRNYFYRVSLIKQQSTIRSLSRENTQSNLGEPKASSWNGSSVPQGEPLDILESTPPRPRNLRNADPVADDHFVSQSSQPDIKSASTNSEAAQLQPAPSAAEPFTTEVEDGAHLELDDIEKELNELDLDLEGVSDTHWSGDEEDIENLLDSD